MYKKFLVLSIFLVGVTVAFNVFGATYVPPKPAPTLEVSASPSSIVQYTVNGEQQTLSTISWTSSGADLCSSTQFNAYSTSGSQYVSPTSTTTYSITCKNTGGSVTKSVTVFVERNINSTVDTNCDCYMSGAVCSIEKVGTQCKVTTDREAGTVLIGCSPGNGTMKTDYFPLCSTTTCPDPSKLSDTGYSWIPLGSSSQKAGSYGSPTCSFSGGICGASKIGQTGRYEEWSGSASDIIYSWSDYSCRFTGPPTATITANPNTINSNQSTTIAWSSEHATSCTISLDSTPWTGTTLSGSKVENDLSAGTHFYKLHCVNAKGSVDSSAVVTVKAVLLSTLDLSASPITLSTNSSGKSTIVINSSNVSNIIFDSPPTRVQPGGKFKTVDFNTTTKELTVTTGPDLATATSGVVTVSAKGIKPDGTSIPASVDINVTVIPPSPSGTLSCTSCTIASGASTCDSILNWSSANLGPDPSIEVTRDNPSNTHVSWNSSGTNVKNAINFGLSNYYLYLNENILASCTGSATATCAPGTSWNVTSNKCLPPAPTVSISANPTFVCPSGSSSLTWSSTNTTSCSGTNFKTNDAVNNSIGVKVNVTVPTSYSIKCIGAGGEVTDTIGVGVCDAYEVAVCDSNHYLCQNSTMSNDKENANDYTWNCTSSSGDVASCSELKPIDGSCSAPGSVASHYNCYKGTSVNNVSGPNSYTWNCNGKNGGKNVSCSENKIIIPPPLPSGNISATYCTIKKNESTCDVKVTWSTKNISPSSITEVTRNNPHTSVSSLPNSPNNFTNTINAGTSIFYLYNSGSVNPLGSFPVRADCVSGTTLIGGICKQNPIAIDPPGGDGGNGGNGLKPLGALSVTSCTIPNNQSTCDVKVTWSTSNIAPLSTTEVTRNNPHTSVSSLPNSPNNFTYTVNRGISSFYLYNSDSVNILAADSVDAKCATGTWNDVIKKCKATTPDVVKGSCSPDNHYVCIPTTVESKNWKETPDYWEWTCGDEICKESRPVFINGVCGVTKNSCDSGSFVDVPDTTTNYLWSCQGSNGSAPCSLSKAKKPIFIED